MGNPTSLHSGPGKTLTRTEMEEVVGEGGSVAYDNKILSTLDTLPSEEDVEAKYSQPLHILQNFNANAGNTINTNIASDGTMEFSWDGPGQNRCVFKLLENDDIDILDWTQVHGTHGTFDWDLWTPWGHKVITAVWEGELDSPPHFTVSNA